MKNIEFVETHVKMPLMSLPVRSATVQLSEAKILISPGSTSTEEQLKKLGSITDIVAPSLLHTGGVPKATAVFPKAKIWGVENSRQAKPQIPWSEILDEKTWPFQKELTLIPLKGIPRLNEVVFIHHESKTLIVCDLCFNLIQTSGIGAWIILHLFGTYHRFAISSFFCRSIKDKTEFQKSIQQIFQYDFENIVLSHGDNIIGDAKSCLAAAVNERGFRAF